MVDKSITQLAADMDVRPDDLAGRSRAPTWTGSRPTTQGQFGFHAFITVAKDAMAQAAAADAARAAGNKGDLLGIPVVVKDLYDTKDMPTTDGSLAFEGWQPKRDAFQVKQLREAGAIILGKGNLSEFANSGSYSESGYGMVWNAFKPSKTSLGSSGGSAVAVATSPRRLRHGHADRRLAVRALAPARRLVTLRGTDGIASGAGVMPLTWLQDFAGPIGAHDQRHRAHPQRHHRHRPRRPLHGPRRRRRQAPGRLEDGAGPERAAGQADRLPAERVHRQPELRPGRRHDRGGHRSLRRHRGRGRDDGRDDRRRAERPDRPGRSPATARRRAGSSTSTCTTNPPYTTAGRRS